MPAPNRVLTPPPPIPSHVRALRPHDSTMPGSGLPSLPPPPSTAVPFALARRALGVTLPPPTLRVPESIRTPPRSSVPPPLPLAAKTTRSPPLPIPAEALRTPMPPIPKAPKLPSADVAARPAPVREEITRPMDVDPELLAASRAAREAREREEAREDRDQALQFVWQGFKLLSAGFLVGAVAVHAIALVRMTRKVEMLSARLDDVVLEQERIAAPTRVPLVRPVAPNTVAAAAPREPDHIVFPALDVGAKENE